MIRKRYIKSKRSQVPQQIRYTSIMREQMLRR